MMVPPISNPYLPAPARLAPYFPQPLSVHPNIGMVGYRSSTLNPYFPQPTSPQLNSEALLPWFLAIGTGVATVYGGYRWFVKGKENHSTIKAEQDRTKLPSVPQKANSPESAPQSVVQEVKLPKPAEYSAEQSIATHSKRMESHTSELRTAIVHKMPFSQTVRHAISHKWVWGSAATLAALTAVEMAYPIIRPLIRTYAPIVTANLSKSVELPVPIIKSVRQSLGKMMSNWHLFEPFSGESIPYLAANNSAVNTTLIQAGTEKAEPLLGAPISTAVTTSAQVINQCRRQEAPLLTDVYHKLDTAKDTMGDLLGVGKKLLSNFSNATLGLNHLAEGTCKFHNSMLLNVSQPISSNLASVANDSAPALITNLSHMPIAVNVPITINSTQVKSGSLFTQGICFIKNSVSLLKNMCIGDPSPAELRFQFIEQAKRRLEKDAPIGYMETVHPQFQNIRDQAAYEKTMDGTLLPVRALATTGRLSLQGLKQVANLPYKLLGIEPDTSFAPAARGLIGLGVLGWHFLTAKSVRIVNGSVHLTY